MNFPGPTKLVLGGGTRIWLEMVSLTDENGYRVTCQEAPIPTFPDLRSKILRIFTFLEGKLFGCNRERCYTYDPSSSREWKLSLEMDEGKDIVTGWHFQSNKIALMTVGEKYELIHVFNGSSISPGLEVKYFRQFLGIYGCEFAYNSSHVFVMEGFRDKRAHLLHLETGKWIRLPDTLEKRVRSGCNKASGGKIVVFGGMRTNTSEIYSFETNTWSRGPELPFEELFGIEKASVYLPEEDTFVIAGGSADTFIAATDKIVKFDPNPNRMAWKVLDEKLKASRRDHHVAEVPYRFNCR